MTKPTRPRSGHAEPRVVEIDAIDVAEWERDQHTPRAPAAGLAALVRQTAALPIADTRTRHPTAHQGSRRGPQKPPPSAPRPATRAASPPPAPVAHAAVPDHAAAPPRAHIEAAPQPPASSRTERISYSPRAPFHVPHGAPPARLDPVSLPEASPLPARLEPAPRPDEPPPARVEPVPLPLIAPPSAPISSASQRIQPMDIDPPPTLRAIPDHTPTPSASDTPAPRQIVDDQAAPPPSLAFSLGSLRTLLIVGTAITATLAIIAVVLGNSDAPAEPASASTTAAVTSPASSAAPSPPGSAAASPAATRPAPVAATTRPTPIEPSPASRTAPVKPSPASPASPAGSAPPSRPSPAAPHPPRTSPSSRGKPVAMTTSPSAIRTSRPLRSERPQRAGPRVASSQRTAPKRTVRGPSLRKVDPEAAAALAADNEPAVAQARAAYAAGNESLFAGDFDTAIRSYRRAVAQAPSYAAGYRGLGLAYAVQGDSDQAIKALRTYLNLAPQAKDVALIKRRIASLQAGHP